MLKVKIDFEQFSAMCKGMSEDEAKAFTHIIACFIKELHGEADGRNNGAIHIDERIESSATDNPSGIDTGDSGCHGNGRADNCPRCAGRGSIDSISLRMFIDRIEELILLSKQLGNAVKRAGG
ncbi:MAG: hypothetical protein RPU12_14795 [Candidatus Sedimenticola sp. (ex Thyasira tokunagai)]